MQRKVIFWDFDGTLVHANTSFADALAAALAGYHKPVEDCALKAFLESACSWHRPERAYPDRTGERWWKDLLDRLRVFCNSLGVEERDVGRICEQFRAHVLRFAYQPYEDARDILAYCQASGYEQYVLSNNFPELVQAARRVRLDAWIDGYFLSSNIGYEKPRVELFQYAARQTNQPDVCYMIGDNPIADMQGGKEAGFRTILVHHPHGCADADAVCDRLIDIRSVLEAARER